MNTISSPLGSMSSVTDEAPREIHETNMGEAVASGYDEPPSVSEETQSLDHEDIELQRISTCHLHHAATMSRAHNQPFRESYVSYGDGISYPQSTDLEKFIVEFDGSEDPRNPKNWTLRKRYVFECAVMCHEFKL